MICGVETQDLSEEERSSIRLSRIGFIFQAYNLFSTLTVGQNIALALELKGVNGREQQAETRRLLDLVGLLEKERESTFNLSGGQKQRVAIARALAGMPEILLADEPTAALDWENGQQILAILRELAHVHERAVVIVSHDARVFEFADRRIFMKDGIAIEAARPLPSMRRIHSLGAAAMQTASTGVG